MTKWTYGPEGERYPVKVGEVWQSGQHVFVCSDLMESRLFDEWLDRYTLDLVYCDPPWGQALANGFRTKAGLGKATYDWLDLYRRVAEIGQASAVPVWVECSKEGTKDGDRVREAIMAESHPHFGYVELTYFRRSAMGLYAASPRPVSEDLLSRLRGVDDEISPLIVLQDYGSSGVVVDPCAGRGLTSRSAQAAGWQSVNNELNPNRVSAALSRLGGDVERISA